MNNYGASVVYGTLAMLLLALVAYVLNERTALILAVWASGCAWASCYCGAASDEIDAGFASDELDPRNNAVYWWMASLVLTVAAIALAIAAIVKITW